MTKFACCVAVSAMAERLANHFASYRPASDLFLQLLDMNKLEDAKFMLAVSISAWMHVCTRSKAESEVSLVLSKDMSGDLNSVPYILDFVSFLCPYGLEWVIYALQLWS